jgi:uncharacterized protein (TIGR04255 family)
LLRKGLYCRQLDVRIPTRLRRPPLVEVAYEIRFSASTTGNTELLPGLLFASLAPLFTQSENTPLGMVPDELRRKHPELMYAAQTQLKGPDWILQIGPQVIGLVTTSYPGWQPYKKVCRKVSAAVRATNTFGSVERLSLKYSNIIEHPPDDPWSTLKISVNVPHGTMSPKGFRLRFEQVQGPLLTIVDCATSATSKQPPRSGLLLSIDTIRESGLSNIEDGLPEFLDETHSAVESLFFGLISDRSLESFEPIWEAS